MIETCKNCGHDKDIHSEEGEKCSLTKYYSSAQTHPIGVDSDGQINWIKQCYCTGFEPKEIECEQRENTTKINQNEICPSCGFSQFVVAKDMHGTRHCYSCPFEWNPLVESNEEKPMEFKVGDIVEWCGIRGVVKNVHPKEHSLWEPDLLIKVQFDFNNRDSIIHHFTLDGRAFVFHKEPSLKLIERRSVEKKKVKKTLELWANIYKNPEEDGLEIHTSKVFADHSNNPNKRIACIKLVGEYEVEE